MMYAAKTTGAIRWRHRGIIFAASIFLLLLSFPHYSCCQETAAVVDDASTAADGTATEKTDGDNAAGGDVTDLGDVVGDAMPDLTEMVEDKLEKENIVEDAGAVSDVDGKTPLEGDGTAAATTTADTDPESTNAEEKTAESSDAAQPSTTESETQPKADEAAAQQPVVQAGPYIDLLGDLLLSLEMVDETHAQVHQHYTNEALGGKKVVGLYFSADW